MPWMFWIIVVIAGLFVARVMAHVIMKPIKQKREERRWQAAKDRWTKELIQL